MKKISQCLLLAIFPLFLQAQNYTNRDKALINTRIDSLLKAYMENSTLTEQGVTKKSKAVIDQFKSLFAKDAMIFDDINPDIDTVLALKADENPYILKTRTLDDYYYGIIEQFPTGILVTNKYININYNSFNEGVVQVALGRLVEAKTYKGFKFRDDDTLMINIRILSDKTVKISSISRIGSRFKVSNDRDLDGVPDEKDECPDKKGPIRFKGCPDTDGDGIPDIYDECPNDPGPASNNGCPPTTFAYRFVISGSVGPSFNQYTLATPALNTLGYMFKGAASIDQTLIHQGVGGSNPGSVSNPGAKVGLNFNANIAYYIGKNRNNRNKGISIGFSYTSFSNTYSISDVHYEYEASDGYNSYRRIITLQPGATESFSFAVLDIPLLFKIKGRFKSKWAYEFGAGVSYMLISATSTERNTSFNIEGIYQYDAASGTLGYKPTYSPSSTDVILTQQQVQNHTIGGNIVTLNSNLSSASNNYDFSNGDKATASPAVALANRSGIALNAGADLFYHINPHFALKAGLSYIYAPSLSNTNGSYKMIDASSDRYNSFYNATSKFTFSAFGINLGIIIGI